MPADLYEAARVDEHPLQMFGRITFPLILPQATTMGLFMLVWQLASFDLIYAMTGGGPGFATQVLAYNIYRRLRSAGSTSATRRPSAWCSSRWSSSWAVWGILLYRRVEVSY